MEEDEKAEKEGRSAGKEALGRIKCMYEDKKGKAR